MYAKCDGFRKTDRNAQNGISVHARMAPGCVWYWGCNMYNPNSKSIGSRITNDMLPRVEDRFSFLYIEYARIIQDEFSIAACQKNKKTIIPLAMVNVLLLGPGTSISHAAMKNIADAGCTAIWCGQDIKYIYSTSMVSSEYSKI